MSLSRARFSLALTAYALASLAGCAQVDVDDCTGPDDPMCGASYEYLRIPGSYVPAAASLSAGSAIVAYDDVPAWDGGAHCTGGFTAGGRALSTHLRANFPGISSIGGYSCRPNTANTAKMSVHGSGRALDIMIPLDRGDADNGIGDPIANWLIAHSSEIGIQYLIWDRTQWSGSRTSSRVRAYTGPNPHIDHIHAEITLPASRQETPFYTGGTMPPPPPPPPPPPMVTLDATFIAQGSDAMADATGAAQFVACAGAPVTFTFEVQNAGTATWTDMNDLAPGAIGRAVRLGVPSNTPDPFIGAARVTLNEASRVEVARGARTTFTLRGAAPTAVGIHRTSWRLLDETRAWFGPDMWLSYRVTDCTTPPPPPPPMSVDADRDGVDATVDCDDTSADVRPGATDLCSDGIDADCDGIDPACMTPRWDELDPLVDDPGFDWNPDGDPVYTRPQINTLHGTGCSASVGGRGNALWVLGVVLGVMFKRSKRAR
jgi:hypothetical protein